MKKLTFKDIVNFFGDRGVILKRNFIKKYGNDEKYIYIIPNRAFDFSDYDCDEGQMFETTLQTTIKEDTVMWFAIHSLYIEIEDEVLLENSPYKWRNHG